MSATKVEQEIIERLHKLDRLGQLKVLQFVRDIESDLQGTSGSDLLRFRGLIDLEDLAAMGVAIEEGCEQVDLKKR